MLNNSIDQARVQRVITSSPLCEFSVAVLRRLHRFGLRFSTLFNLESGYRFSVCSSTAGLIGGIYTVNLQAHNENIRHNQMYLKLILVR